MTMAWLDTFDTHRMTMMRILQRNLLQSLSADNAELLGGGTAAVNNHPFDLMAQLQRCRRHVAHFACCHTRQRLPEAGSRAVFPSVAARAVCCAMTASLKLCHEIWAEIQKHVAAYLLNSLANVRLDDGHPQHLTKQFWTLNVLGACTTIVKGIFR